MKYLTLLSILTCLVGTQMESRADLVVTLGGVTGVNTNLDVSIEGSGTIPLGAANDLRYIGVFAVESGTGNSTLFADTHFFATEIEGNVGDYVTSLYNFYSAPLTSPITLFNTTDATTTQIEYLQFDNDAGVGDDFNLLFFAPDLFIEPGDSWTISGSSQVVLGKGDSSVFTLGTYGFTDDGIGDMTLIIQEGSAVVPEPSSVLSFIFGALLLLYSRKKKVA